MRKCILLLAVIAISAAKLVQVVSFFRHGARYALNSLYDGNETKYIWGELTSVGMRQHQTFGQIMRKQYIERLGFLSPTYNHAEIQVYSTAINRTVQSVTSQLYGLYPLGSGPKLLNVDKQYYIPPFSNKTDDAQRNFALPNGHQIIPVKFDQKVLMDNCQYQTREMQKNIQLQLEAYNEMNMTYWPFIRRMSTIFNLTGNVTLATLSTLNSDLQCDLYQGKILPTEFTPDDQKNIMHIDSWYKQFTFVKDLAKAVNRDRFVKIINMFDGRISNPNSPLKMTFLSAHDLDIVATYNDLNLSSSQCIEELYRKGQTSALNCQSFPKFASSLIFELYIEGSNHIIKIRSNGQYMNLCGQRSTQCKYEDWKKRVQSNMASDQLVDSICGKKSKVQQTQDSNKSLWQRLRQSGVSF